MNTLSKKEFDVLLAIWRHPDATQRQLSEYSGVGLSTVNATLKKLTQRNLYEDGRITAEGVALMKPYHVDNAVIMAAGLSSRFAPISYERPKGLLKVRGEVLIERLIEQLHEAGIFDIVVVVGYKKEQFFYLEEKYGIQIMVNNEYASRNNNSTLHVVHALLSNTYICSSDDYYTENPFNRYEYGAYYAGQYADGATDEWCMETGSWGRITSVTVGGSNAWYMVGHAYFDRAFSQRFAEILEGEYALPETADKLWEQLYVDHIDELSMMLRKYPDGVIHEFDSLQDLREFDPLFLENLDSQIFDNICAVLGCTKSEIRDVYPLKQGLTNLSCHFTIDDGEYVYRHSGVGTEKMINREAEAQAQLVAARLGLDDTFVFESPRHGWKISRFIVNCRQLDAQDDAQLERAMQMARTLHGSGAALDRRFDYFEESLSYERHLREKGPIQVPDYAAMSEQARRLNDFVKADGAPVCLTHNDFFNLNLLLDQNDKLFLIDWEYAGMSDYASDYGTFVVTCMLDEERADKALSYYFDGAPTPADIRHNYAHVALAGWCWYVWALLKEAEGDFVGDWLLTYYRYAKKYMAKSLALYEEAN